MTFNPVHLTGVRLSEQNTAGGRIVRLFIPNDPVGNVRQEKGSSLTAREEEVVYLLLQAKSTKEIASLLGISTKTVETHRRHIFRKAGVRTVLQFVVKNLTAIQLISGRKRAQEIK